MLRAFTKPSAEAEKFTKALKEMGIANLTLRDVSEMGFAKTIQELQRTISPYGDLINRIVEVKKAQGELNSETEEASLRQSLYNQALAIMFPNVRGIRSVLGLLLSDNYQDYEEILTAILNKELTLDDALKKQIDTMEYQKDVVAALGRAIRDELFLNLRGPLVDILKMINEPLQEIINTDDFRNASFTGKLNQVWDSVFGSFDTWYQGSGRSMVSGFTSQLTQFLTEFLTNPDTLALVTDLASNIGTAIAQGMLEGLKNSLSELLIPDIIHRSIMYNPSHVSHVEYQRQFPERYKRLYGDASPYTLEGQRYNIDYTPPPDPNKGRPIINPGERMPSFRLGGTRVGALDGYGLTTVRTTDLPKEIDNSISAQWRRIYPDYASAKFKEEDDLIRIDLNDYIHRYRKDSFTFDKLFEDIKRQERYQKKISEYKKENNISLTPTPTPTPTPISQMDSEKASRLIGPTNQAKLEIKVGDITISSDDKKILEKLAYILEYADVPQEQIGQMQYLFDLEQGTA